MKLKTWHLRTKRKRGYGVVSVKLSPVSPHRRPPVIGINNRTGLLAKRATSPLLMDDQLYNISSRIENWYFGDALATGVNVDAEKPHNVRTKLNKGEPSAFYAHPDGSLKPTTNL